jgi:hypothetical protein
MPTTVAHLAQLVMCSTLPASATSEVLNRLREVMIVEVFKAGDDTKLGTHAPETIQSISKYLGFLA